MRRILMFGTLIVVAFLLLMFAPPAAALPDNAESMNARFVKWQEKPHVIHIFIFADAGRPGQPAAEADEGQPVLFGFEWAGATTVADLQAGIIGDPLHDITLSVDGGAPFTVKDRYQDAFFAATRSGPAWSWDHDGDGPGDKDGDGIGDFAGPVLFFRYQSPGLTTGTHTFSFCVTFDGGITFGCELITVEAG